MSLPRLTHPHKCRKHEKRQEGKGRGGRPIWAWYCECGKRMD